MHSVTVQYREQMHKYRFNPFLGFSPSDTQLLRKVLMFLVHCVVIVICHLFWCLLHHFILVSPEILRDIFGIFIKLLFPARFSYKILRVWTKLGYTAQVWIDGPSVGDFCVVVLFFFVFFSHLIIGYSVSHDCCHMWCIFVIYSVVVWRRSEVKIGMHKEPLWVKARSCQSICVLMGNGLSPTQPQWSGRVWWALKRCQPQAEAVARHLTNTSITFCGRAVTTCHCI